MDSVYSFLEYKLKKGRIAFSNEIPDDLRFIFDVHDFQQMLLNLYINAVHAMKEGGTLGVRGYKEDSFVTIEVSDTGCGIGPENIGRIFNEFEQIKDADSGKSGGVGLGLNIVKQYLDLMNGEIQVESQPGKGTTFTFTLPRSIALHS